MSSGSKNAGGRDRSKKEISASACMQANTQSRDYERERENLNEFPSICFHSHFQKPAWKQKI